MKRPIVLIHFQPPELYPPVMNLINSVPEDCGGRQLDVYTTYCYADVGQYEVPNGKIKINRFGSRKRRHSAAGRAWHYFRFYFFTLWRLLVTRPDTIIYYETFSAFPAYVYKKFFNRKCRLFIHYHEYMTPSEYANGMLLIKWFHGLEKKLYPQTSWVSHTNSGRMKRFSEDLAGISIPHKYLLPNYPPAGWRTDRTDALSRPVKAVYIGSFSLDTMYVKEFAGWVLTMNGAITWDIYSLNITKEAADFIGTFPSDLIKVYPGISYDNIPALLTYYDMGLILYKGHIPNWIDNAPNKLFEYFSSGLDVWLPFQMTGSLPYVTKGTYPRVMALDFEKMEEVDFFKATDNSGLVFKPSSFYSEQVYAPLWEKLLNA